jgi:hypothetical protein
VWGKLVLFLLLGVVLVGFVAVTKPSEAELRQAIRDKGKDLQARGVRSPPVLLEDPQYAGRFTYHAHLFSSEIRFTRDDGKDIVVARGQLLDITVSESWEGVR